MKRERPDLTDKLLSSSEIADLLGVNLAAVSNYKKRHADFPDPAYRHPSAKGATLYWTDQVIEWAEAHYEGGIEKVADNLEERAARLVEAAARLRRYGGSNGAAN